ncbi:MAG: NUDIX domain-containing protein [Ilumatobacteraceae bacterium]
MSGPHFRVGVVVVVRRPGQVLAFERCDSPGSWQLPQGGVDLDESLVDAAWRELGEETGLGPTEVELVAQFPEWLAYEWPEEIRRVKGGECHRIGQVQRWFLFDARAPEIEPQPDGREFCAWRWVEPAWLVDHVPAWRRAPYRRVLSGP